MEIAFTVLFLPLRNAASTSWSPSPSVLAQPSSTSHPPYGLVYLCLALIIVFSSAAGLASGGNNVAVQRDWFVRLVL